ncbi:dTDP-4-dehydrorhamnose 3,5-epimerase [Propionivibrio dicarboxylicus]|uniref:dTDP-4-dehydrorhamnose 3,5-epimerase n=1 Tax=Propionivibrio dicarboxylicus TaxID=83767 RepID=A0A1G8DYB2_9RHOO|nr:dTDP-4-dehydrorhamnose 3,5-epimerase [Propionivibrio dicarboxylicus]SDH62643.1 dTDP-4-dehydrorhamnose 3,5-epimerase [Propionivibrio dicarboxylicus]
MTRRFELISTPLSGLMLLQRLPLGDDRGYLERLFCEEELQPIMQERRIVQVNHTLTGDRGTVRGMHYQLPPDAEMKFVTCLRGEVYDVAVDLRRNSPTFLHWHAEILSEKNHKTLVIPEGYAHGFQTMSDNCEMLYFHTKAYCPGAERGLQATDPELSIDWPLPVVGQSPRDKAHSPLDPSFEGVVF